MCQMTFQTIQQIEPLKLERQSWM